MATIAREKPTFYGQTTEKDVPYLLLAGLLGVWGRPANLPAPQARRPATPQRDLFETA